MIRHKTMRQIAFVFTLALLAEAGTVHAQIGNAAALSPEKTPPFPGWTRFPPSIPKLR